MPSFRESLDRNLAHRLRRAVGPRVNDLARALGQPSYRVRRAEYVGTVHRPVEALAAALGDAGFVWDPISLYHRTPEGTTSDGSWTYRPSPFADRQLHVVLFAQAADRVDVYAHDEYNWLRHPVKHAERRDIRRRQGADQMRLWLDARGVDYDRESTARRTAAHGVEGLRERFVDQEPTER